MSNYFITQVSAHEFVIREEDSLVPRVVAKFVATEVRQGNSPQELDQGNASWGFELRDEAGNMLLSAAPGWWEAASACVTGFLAQFASDPQFSADWVELRKIGIVPICLMTPEPPAVQPAPSGDASSLRIS